MDAKDLAHIDLEYGPEWALLELLTKGVESAEDRETVERLLALPALNWGELLEQAIRHRIDLLLAYQIVEQNIKAPRYIKELLRNNLRLNQHRIAIQRSEAADLVNLFQRHNIPVAARKGIVFESTIYQGRGTRSLGDLDFMILPEDVARVKQAMPELGYEVGFYDEVTAKIVPHRRDDIIMYRLNPDHLPKFVHLVDDHFVRYTNIDLATSFAWTGSEYDVPLAEAFKALAHQPIPGVEGTLLPVFPPSLHFILAILHFYREAWFIRDHYKEKDVNLSKCCDLILTWNAYPGLRTPELKALIEQYNLVEPTAWVLEHIDHTFGTQMVATLGLSWSPSEEVLASANLPGNKIARWSGNMRERLQRKERREIFSLEGM